MTMLAKTTETRALTLADYEARIHLYKEQIGTGYIGIGRTLLEAKEAKVVPHGQWEAWVTETTGLTPRQAQRCMQAATEIKDGSAMARLEMSKALMLLGSGLDEETREEIAEKAADEGATVKDLREQLRKAKLQIVQETGASAEIREALKNAEAEREHLEQQIRARESAYQDRIEEAKEEAFQRGEKAAMMEVQVEVRQLRRDLENNKRLRQSLEDQLTNARNAKPAVIEKVPADYEGLKRNQADLLAAAEEAEKRAANAEAELEALRAGQDPDKVPAVIVLHRALMEFYDECELMPYYPTDLQSDRQPIMEAVAGLETWCSRMRNALEAPVDGEGAVE